jgi:hypothetical protein
VTKAKPFDIPKREVWEAFKKVKANRGAAGVDGQSIAEFETALASNLYRLFDQPGDAAGSVRLTVRRQHPLRPAACHELPDFSRVVVAVDPSGARTISDNARS